MAKSADAFRTISEVSDWLKTPAHVLRFWESRFSQVKPVKRAGGRRYYRPNDMLLLGGIRRLLHDDGITIKGVQKIIREKGVKYVSGLSAGLPDGTPDEDSAGQPDANTDTTVVAAMPQTPRQGEAVPSSTSPAAKGAGSLEDATAALTSAEDTDDSVDDTPATAAANQIRFGRSGQPADDAAKESPNASPELDAAPESTDSRILILYQRLHDLRDRMQREMAQE